jgi:capsular exopolysaccharide synthesis family protein
MVSPAGVPVRPTFPNLPLFLTAAFLTSVGSGVGVALLRDKFLARVTSLEQASAVTGLPGLGVLPHTPFHSPMHRRIVERPKSAAAEAMRTLRSVLALLQPLPDVSGAQTKALAPTGPEHGSMTTGGHFPGGHLPGAHLPGAHLPGAMTAGSLRMLAITSALPGEGKTTVAVSLARSMALSGLSVLLIDADLRKPKVARLVQGSLPLGPGLAAAIENDLPLEAVLMTDHATSLCVLHANDRMPNASPQDMLASQAMHRLFAEAAEAFDYIIVDTPPAAIVADATIIGRLVEQTLVVVQWNRTPLAALRAAAKILARARVPVIGIVLNNANPMRLPEYGGGSTYAVGGRDRYFEA